eukprot:TRINITY_DN8568_c0_g2_i1.p1 TRINITY_DN8568_c0_g2~~TRINITY_DN8568_c0_g2_i1.p1  ORF type:complete len:263 (-),score=47.81 TRINITY_DN8568_c0_g2_i1:195-983(-)
MGQPWSKLGMPWNLPTLLFPGPQHRSSLSSDLVCCCVFFGVVRGGSCNICNPEATTIALDEANAKFISTNICILTLSMAELFAIEPFVDCDDENFIITPHDDNKAQGNAPDVDLFQMWFNGLQEFIGGNDDEARWNGILHFLLTFFGILASEFASALSMVDFKYRAMHGRNKVRSYYRKEVLPMLNHMFGYDQAAFQIVKQTAFRGSVGNLRTQTCKQHHALLVCVATKRIPAKDFVDACSRALNNDHVRRLPPPALGLGKP